MRHLSFLGQQHSDSFIVAARVVFGAARVGAFHPCALAFTYGATDTTSAFHPRAFPCTYEDVPSRRHCVSIDPARNGVHILCRSALLSEWALLEGSPVRRGLPVCNAQWCTSIGSPRASCLQCPMVYVYRFGEGFLSAMPNGVQLSVRRRLPVCNAQWCTSIGSPRRDKLSHAAFRGAVASGSLPVCLSVRTLSL